MTVSTTSLTNAFTGDGVTTTFPFTFACQQPNDVQVYVANALQVSGYTVSLNSNGVGGTVNFISAPAAAALGLIVRNVSLTQQLSLNTEGDLPSGPIEDEFDRLVMADQQLNNQLDLCMSLPITDQSNFSTTIPYPPVPLDLIRCNAAGTAWEYVTPAQAQIDAGPGGPLPQPAVANDILGWDPTGTFLINVARSALAGTPGTGTVVGPSTSVAYSIVLWNNTLGTLVKTGPALGTTGQVLTSNGASADPSFQSIVPAVKPLSLGKKKHLTQPSFNNLLIQLTNNTFVQGGNFAGCALGSTDGTRPFGGLAWDPINPPAAGSTIVDWDYSGNNLYVITKDGTNNHVYAAGQNAAGQLGQGDTTVRNILTRIAYFETNGIEVNAVYCSPGGADTTIAQVFFVTSLNKVYACGYNNTGQLGIGNTTAVISTPTLAYTSASPITSIITNEVTVGITAMLLSTGVMYMTGWGASGALGQSASTNLSTFTAVPGITGITSIGLFASYNPSSSTGYATAMAITSAASGSLYVWGSNDYYAGANGGTAIKTAPGTAILTNIAKAGFIGAGGITGVWAQTNANDLYTWGANGQNNLFQNSTTTSQTPVKVFSTTAAQVWGWYSHSAAAYGNIYVLDTAGIMRYAGTNTVNCIFPTSIDTVFAAAGTYRCALPALIQNGSETISDILFISKGNAAANNGFILTSGGSLFGGGYGSDYMVTNWQAAAAGSSSTIYNHRMNTYLWGT